MPLYTIGMVVTIKTTVNDPEGNTIAGALQSLGFDTVGSVRAGKYIQITLLAVDEQQAKERAEQMAKRLLVNPVLEVFEIIGVEPVAETAKAATD